MLRSGKVLGKCSFTGPAECIFICVCSIKFPLRYWEANTYLTIEGQVKIRTGHIHILKDILPVVCTSHITYLRSMGKHRQTTNVAGAENGEELSKFRNIIVTVLKGNDTSDAKKNRFNFRFRLPGYSSRYISLLPLLWIVGSCKV